MDHFVKEVLRAKGYVRYVDDFVLFHDDREQLEEWRGRLARNAVSLSPACVFAPGVKSAPAASRGRSVPGATPRFAVLRSAYVSPLRSTPRSTFGRGRSRQN